MQVASGKLPRLQIFGSDYDTHDGTGVRDYIHISDLSAGHVSSLKCILKSDFSGFMAFNLGKRQNKLYKNQYDYIIL